MANLFQILTYTKISQNGPYAESFTDAVSQSQGAVDAGKIPVLDAQGRLDPSVENEIFISSSLPDSSFGMDGDYCFLSSGVVGPVGGGSGGSGVWGFITGTLSDQTDLMDALNVKAGSLLVSTVEPDPTFGSEGDYCFIGGGAGTIGSVMNWQGVWMSTTTYRQYDAVSYQGSSYIGLKTDNLGNPPSESPTWWGVLAEGTSGGSGGTVTSVGLSTSGVLHTITGSPITTSGTLTLNLNSQPANKVFAGPTSGASTSPSFRALVPADLPVATSTALGAVRPDGTTITVSNGVISSTGGGGGGGTTPIFGTSNPNGTGTPSVVQSNSSASGATVSTPSSVMEGNLLLVAVEAKTNAAATISDNIGTSYTLIYRGSVGTLSGLAVFSGIAPASGACTVTVSGTGTSHQAIGVVEFNNVTNTLDAPVQSAVGLSTTTTTLSVTTTSNNDLLVAVFGDDWGNNTGSPSSGWTKLFFNQGANYVDLGIAYRVAPTPSSYSVYWTETSSANYEVMLSAYQPASTPVSGSEGQLYFAMANASYSGFVYHGGTWHPF